jgi:hypothetical protein
VWASKSLHGHAPQRHVARAAWPLFKHLFVVSIFANRAIAASTDIDPDVRRRPFPFLVGRNLKVSRFRGPK